MHGVAGHGGRALPASSQGHGGSILIRKSIGIIATTCAAYFLLCRLNTALFSSLGYSDGVDWVFLPSGLRLAFVLVFVEEGALGIMLASALVGGLYHFSDDVVTALGAGFISGFAPWLARLVCLDRFKLDVNLRGLTAVTLIKVSLVFSALSPVLHQLWFSWRGRTEDFISSTAVMAVGDLVGTLLVMYSVKMLAQLVPAPGTGG